MNLSTEGPFEPIIVEVDCGPNSGDGPTRTHLDGDVRETCGARRRSATLEWVCSARPHPRNPEAHVWFVSGVSDLGAIDADEPLRNGLVGWGDDL